MNKKHSNSSRITILMLAIMITATNSSIAQTNIQKIRTVFKTVNSNLKNYKKTEIPLNESTEGGSITTYLNKDKLQKIEVKHFGEMGKKYIDYYFLDNEVVFVFYQEFEYNMPVYMKNSKIIKTVENRCYLNNSKIFKWIDADKNEVSKSKFKLQDARIVKSLRKINRKIYENKIFKQLEATIFKVIKAFQNKDERTLNKLISKETGLYIIFRRGTMDGYIKKTRIDFKNPIPEYLPYNYTSNYKTVKFEELPSFDCATMNWNKQGLFCNLGNQNNLLSTIAKDRKEFAGEDISYNQIVELKEFERHTERIIATDELIFHLTLIKDKWYLSVIDRATTDCSA